MSNRMLSDSEINTIVGLTTFFVIIIGYISFLCLKAFEENEIKDDQTETCIAIEITNTERKSTFPLKPKFKKKLEQDSGVYSSSEVN